MEEAEAQQAAECHAKKEADLQALRRQNEELHACPQRAARTSSIGAPAWG